MSSCRVLIIDDSAVSRRALSDILSTDPDIDVVGTAPDAMIGLRKIEALSPDVLTLDVEMPGMDGLTFLERLMKSNPMPVVMVSAYTEAGSDAAIRSLELGAVDVVEKPRYEVREGLSNLSELIIDKVKGAALAQVASPSMRFFEHNTGESAVISVTQESLGHAPLEQLVAIGASTGGPQAIRQVLEVLPASMPPVLVVQHITPSFTESFAKSLDANCQLSVQVGRDGVCPEPGNVYIAPGDRHMLLTRSGTDYVLALADHDRVNRHRPSVDELFKSVAVHAGQSGTGILLTGMGVDGAIGLKMIRESGGQTFVQDEASSVVFGMPRAAVELDAADTVLGIDRIAEGLTRYVFRNSEADKRRRRGNSI